VGDRVEMLCDYIAELEAQIARMAPYVESRAEDLRELVRALEAEQQAALSVGADAPALRYLVTARADADRCNRVSELARQILGRSGPQGVRAVAQESGR
jgi:hypothetical protein